MSTSARGVARDSTRRMGQLARGREPLQKLFLFLARKGTFPSPPSNTACCIWVKVSWVFATPKRKKGVSFKLILPSQSDWSRFNGTWQKRSRELDRCDLRTNPSFSDSTHTCLFSRQIVTNGEKICGLGNKNLLASIALVGELQYKFCIESIGS